MGEQKYKVGDWIGFDNKGDLSHTMQVVQIREVYSPLGFQEIRYMAKDFSWPYYPDMWRKLTPEEIVKHKLGIL